MTTSVRLGEPFAPEAVVRVRRALQLRHFKWDTQVGDACVLLPQPLLIVRSEWERLCVLAEHAARELYSLERLVAARPDLQRTVGVPRRLRPFLDPAASADAPRVLRFDFHPTREGWVVSEVNADVPGGFGEASALPALFTPWCDGAVPPCPLTAWGEAVAAAFAPGRAAVLYAPGHLEDQQVALTLGSELLRRGFAPRLVQSPADLRWEKGRASVVGTQEDGLAVVIRFYQAEWLAGLPERSGWQELFRRPAATGVLHPPECLVSESKRLGLIFDAPGVAADTLRGLFPACRHPQDAGASERENWVLKPAYGNTGDQVLLGSDLTAKAWRRLRWRARWNAAWVAQHRFETLALPSVWGPLRPCVGIYVVGGRAAGAYVRLSRGQVTDATACEAPLFILPDHSTP